MGRGRRGGGGKDVCIASLTGSSYAKKRSCGGHGLGTRLCVPDVPANVC